MNLLYMLFALAAGAGTAVQAAVNTQLRFVLGAPIWAALGQSLVLLTLLGSAALVTRQPAPVTDGLSRAPWWIWLGGIFGATYLLMSVIVTPRLGAAVMLATTIVGMLSAALVIDHFGWFGAAVVPITASRVAGALLLALGVIVMRW